MRPLYSVYAAVSMTALLGLTFAAFPKVARSGKLVFRCGTYDPTPIEAKKAEFYLNKALTGNGNLKSGGEHIARGPGSTLISVYFHVITTKDGSLGNVTNAQIQAQIAVMNKIYSGQDPLPAGVKPLGPALNTPYRFVLAGIDRTANDDYFNKGVDFVSADTEKKMKQALRIGGAKALNVYTNNLLTVTGGVLGYAAFPQDYRAVPWHDGIVLDYGTLPGGDLDTYSIGKVLAHETGHWLGLYHPFQGGCAQANDYVDDTPAQAYQFFGVWFPPGYPGYITDTCTGRYFPGKDPVDNYMNYTDPTGMARFTIGQLSRIDSVCRIYRGL